MLRVESLHMQVGTFSLRDVSFEVEEGAYFVLLGASGVGKTLVLEALAGLMPISAGRIVLGEADITDARIQDRALGLVYQDQALFPHLTVQQNIAYGLRKGDGRGRDEVVELAANVGVEPLLQRYPETLSGGEAQRVALARALATRPQCLLLDEPLSALDTRSRSEMRALLRGLHRKGQSVVHVTHDYEEAMSLATCVGVMEKGTVVQTGSPDEVFHHPKSEFVARFVGIRNVFSGRLGAAEPSNPGVAPFMSGEVRFWVLTDVEPGPGMMILRSEDITLSRACPESSAQNCFAGKVTDVIPARLGFEVCVDIGVPVEALVTSVSVERLGLRNGQDVWLSFKASAARFVEE